jgi:hypothetical protein
MKVLIAEKEDSPEIAAKAETDIVSGQTGHESSKGVVIGCNLVGDSPLTGLTDSSCSLAPTGSAAVTPATGQLSVTSAGLFSNNPCSGGFSSYSYWPTFHLCCCDCGTDMC